MVGNGGDGIRKCIKDLSGREMDVSWRTLKRKLKTYDTGGRALAANLTRRMATVALDLEQSTVDKLSSKEEIKR